MTSHERQRRLAPRRELRNEVPEAPHADGGAPELAAAAPLHAAAHRSMEEVFADVGTAPANVAPDGSYDVRRCSQQLPQPAHVVRGAVAAGAQLPLPQPAAAHSVLTRDATSSTLGSGDLSRLLQNESFCAHLGSTMPQALPSLADMSLGVTQRSWSLEPAPWQGDAPPILPHRHSGLERSGEAAAAAAGGAQRDIWTEGSVDSWPVHAMRCGHAGAKRAINSVQAVHQPPPILVTLPPPPPRGGRGYNALSGPGDSSVPSAATMWPAQSLATNPSDAAPRKAYMPERSPVSEANIELERAPQRPAWSCAPKPSTFAEGDAVDAEAGPGFERTGEAVAPHAFAQGARRRHQHSSGAHPARSRQRAEPAARCIHKNASK
jgi:hypothetical protein